MFGGQTCLVCTQLEYVFPSRVQMKTTVKVIGIDLKASNTPHTNIQPKEAVFLSHKSSMTSTFKTVCATELLLVSKLVWALLSSTKANLLFK